MGSCGRGGGNGSSRGCRLLLAALVWLAPAPAIAWEWVSVLADHQSSVERRVEQVLEADEQILVSTFIVGEEPFSMTAMALLRSAARRGLEVRLLVDAQWNKMPEAIEAHLIREGVEVRRYHPFRLCHPWWITKRLHDKLLIVDGESLVVGGRNIESPYFGFGRQLARRDYLDLDLLVEGPVAARARDYFLAVWESDHVVVSPARAAEAELRAAREELDRHQRWLDGQIAKRSIPGSRSESHRIWVDELEFLHDPTTGKGKGLGVGTELLELLEGAEHRIVLESPYLIPTRPFRRGLQRAIDRGVEVRILTNSLASTDNLLAQAGYVGKRKRLVRMGVELWEYRGPESVHTKAGVLDDEVLLVGSFNLDPRSAFLNTEVAVAVQSPEAARRVGRIFDSHLESAHRIDERGWPVGSDERYPGVSRGKVWKLRLFRLFAPLIRRQL